ncbi:MAG: hypothetical protein NWF03_09075 [Candidatus Bathyarchaeota archaeon]|nr:hypothetical protein [Candidatus Bathyarchaeota archaeon]
MTPAEEHIEKAINALAQENYYEAMTNFTKAYNLTGNIKPLMMSADASFKLATNYLKNEDLRNWDTFSLNAIDHFETCVRYTTSDEIRKMAQDQINKIKELRQKVQASEKHSEGVQALKEGMEHFQNKDYFKASSCFLKSYNISGDAQTLFFAAEAELQLSTTYLDMNDEKNWRERSKTAIQWFNMVIKYSDSSELKEKAAARIKLIEDFMNKYDSLMHI